LKRAASLAFAALLCFGAVAAVPPAAAPASVAAASPASIAAAAPASIAAASPASIAAAAPADVASLAPAPEPGIATTEKCGVVYEAAEGKTTSTLLPSLHVMGLGDDAVFALPPDAPANVKAVQCGRDVIVPQRNDYKVLLAGLPFLVISDNRAAALEAADGKLRVRLVKGLMTEAEQAQVQAFLNVAQPAFDKKRESDAKPQ
jgi:hypothetical protein